MFDEMDGKQARRTGSSSPLGLLFDHGCDAVTCGLSTTMIAKLIQIGNNNVLLFALLATTQAFFFAILEEYYNGCLYLGPFNGVSDGSVILICLALYCGVYGNEFFAQDVQLTWNG